MSYLHNPKNVLCGDRVQFTYNRSERSGVVDSVQPTCVVLKHDNVTATTTGKAFASYRFDRLGSQINLVDHDLSK